MGLRLKFWMTVVIIVGVLPLIFYGVIHFRRMRYSPEILERCYTEAVTECRVGGRGDTTCYYDSQEQRFAPGSFFDKSQKDKCLAVRSYNFSVQTCYNDFELKREGTFVPVPCEDFYRAIQEKNSSCGDCVREISMTKK